LAKESIMDHSQRLLEMSKELDMPIQVSATDGAIRRMAERVEKIRLDTVVTEDSAGGCGGVPGGWGN
jgi:hypothetical protein